MLDFIASCRSENASRSSTRATLAGLLIAAAGTPVALAQNSSAGLETLAAQPLNAPETANSQPRANIDEQPQQFDEADAPSSTGLKNEDSRVDVQGDTDQLIVDLHVNDEDLANVLELLSIQSQKNIVASKNVNARVTANLYGVTFFEALDAILHINGFGYIQRGNFIYIYTIEELKEIEKQSRQRITAVIKLNYLTAIDAAEFVKPVLSEGGQIKTNGKTATFQIPDSGPVGADEYASDAMLVIYDYEENVEEIKKLVVSLDTRPAQVLVEATIMQTSLSEANAFGVDFALIGDLNFIDFVEPSGPLGVVDGLRAGTSAGYAGPGATSTADRPAPRDGDGRALASTPGNTGGPSTFKLGLVAGNDVAVFMRLLDEVTDTTILSNPKILALNRQPARVLVGRKVGYLNTTSTDTSTTQTVQFLDTGTQLYFRPFVTNEGLIRLELKPQVSEAVIRDTRDATGAAVTIPDEITNELVTNVLVRDGQTVVLGGLFRESTTSTRRQVPVLGDIPLIGAAFRGNEDDTQRSEIIFMITPSIVNDNVLLDQGRRAADTVERARAGAREGMLPFSRERMTGELLVEAQRLADEGQTEKALWKIRQSLAMNPRQPDAIALRERLTGQRDIAADRSLLNQITRPGASQPAPIPAPVSGGVSEVQPTPSTPEPGASVSATPVPAEATEVTTRSVDAPTQPLVAANAAPTDAPLASSVTHESTPGTAAADSIVTADSIVAADSAAAAGPEVVSAQPVSAETSVNVVDNSSTLTPGVAAPVIQVPPTSTDMTPAAAQRRLGVLDRVFGFFRGATPVVPQTITRLSPSTPADQPQAGDSDQPATASAGSSNTDR